MSMSLWDLYGLSGADSVQDLLRAKELNLAADNLTLVPEAIGQLTNLTVVWLNNNEISSLPESIGELTNLVMMYIQKNPITELPQSMTRLQKLRILQIESGGKSAVQRAPIGITALPCWTNHTKGYDMQLSISDSLKRLTLFKYDNENLTDIASLVDKWRSCDSINIAQNKISTLPQQLSTLTSLCDLNLSLNAVSPFFLFFFFFLTDSETHLYLYKSEKRCLCSTKMLIGVHSSTAKLSVSFYSLCRPNTFPGDRFTTFACSWTLFPKWYFR
eukprot:TRINITY_DN4076_c0_g1_i3.p1 TRINITY_DN4076_c0_g1~~TRINITY_DN4076_c0_g1_i3.p1  ORF type:complete len:273 (+),score=39.14 TRINITY_DN4076_c0_g1_i3:79-897(+)